MTNEILTKLALPFHPTRITWKPGATKKDKAMALAYADPRAYMERLDEVCGMGWAVSYTPWGERIICHVTINGITRSSTGESDSQSERSEIGGTASEAQAFKRACAMFGLGRYLYNMPSVWVEFDAEQKRFTEKAKARLHGIITQHYQRAMEGVIDEYFEQIEGETVETDSKEKTKAALTKVFEELGRDLYQGNWPQVRAKNIASITEDKPESLTDEHIQKLINGMNKLKNRVPVAA